MVRNNKSEMVSYDVEIKSLILTVRGKQVLLDSDVVQLYGYETMRINEAAQRNMKRFHPKFRFQLTSDEIDVILKSQSVISRSLSSSHDLISQLAISSSVNTVKHGDRKKLPFAYTN